MLQKLIIKNYALIDEVELGFTDGLTIITGETGAGKSIMLGAIGLLLGNRADIKSISDRERKTIVEAIFSTDDSDNVSEIIARREITPSGRSRAFLDDSPVTLPELAETTARLLDIHSQHASLRMNTPEGQRSIIDAIADVGDEAAEYRALFREYVAMRNSLRRMREDSKWKTQRRRELSGQLQHLMELKLKPGEQKEIEHRFEMLSDADEIRESLSAARYLLDNDEKGALGAIREACELIEDADAERLEAELPRSERLGLRLRNIYIELKDISESVGRLVEDVDSNPALLASVTERMKVIHDAVRAFHVEDADALIVMREDLKRELDEISADPDMIHAIERELRNKARVLKDKADALSEKRMAAAHDFSSRLTDLAMPLGLPNLQFEVEITTGKLTSEGQDIIEFKCRLNKNGKMLPMAETASGGELSRLTLCIKYLLAETIKMPTLIFDEIDTGVSGEIADKMGSMMLRMSESSQIIAITHLPQVAAKGRRHFKVFKKDTEERTVSHVTLLNEEERVIEIAGMMSGERLTDAALAAARELIEDKILPETNENAGL